MSSHPKVLLCLAHGSSAIEVVTLMHLFQDAGIELITGSIDEEGALELTGAQGIPLRCQAPLSKVVDDEFDALILPDGETGSRHFSQNLLIQGAIDQFHSLGRIVAVSGSSVALTLVPVNCYPIANLTGCPVTRQLIPSSQWQERRVVWDPRFNLITSQGTGASMDLALKLIELLRSKEQAKRSAAPLALAVGIYNYQE